MKRNRLSLFVRVLLMTGAATLLWLVVQSTIDAVFGAGYDREAHVIRAVTIFCLAVSLVLLARRVLDKQTSVAKLGLSPVSQGIKPFFIGMIIWLVPAALGLVLFLLMGMGEISTDVTASALVLNLLSLVALVFIFEAFPEELIFRGYIFQNIAESKPLWIAVVAQAALFSAWGIFNGGPITLDRIVLFAVFGVLLGIVRAITGNLWTTIGFHVASQSVVQFFGTVGGQISVQSADNLNLLVFGVLPCAMAVPILRHFYKKPVNWQKPAPKLIS